MVVGRSTRAAREVTGRSDAVKIDQVCIRRAEVVMVGAVVVVLIVAWAFSQFSR